MRHTQVTAVLAASIALICSDGQSMLSADESDSEEDADVGDADTVDTSNIPSSSKEVVPRRVKQTVCMSTGGKTTNVPPSSIKQAPPSSRKQASLSSAPADKQVNPPVAQVLRLDKRDLKKLEELVQQDSRVRKKMENDMQARVQAEQARVQAEQALQVTYKVNADQFATCFATERSYAKTVYWLQGMWADEKARRTLLETEVKQVKEDLAQERLRTMSIRVERDLDREKLVAAEAEYTVTARRLEAVNYENRQMIRDHDALQDAAYKEFTEQLLAKVDSLLTEKLGDWSGEDGIEGMLITVQNKVW